MSISLKKNTNKDNPRIIHPIHKIRDDTHIVDCYIWYLLKEYCDKPYTNFMIIGKKSAGKSSLVWNILDRLYNKYKDYTVDIFTNIDNYTTSYSDIDQDELITLHLDYDSSVIEEYIKSKELELKFKYKAAQKKTRIFIFDSCYNEDEMLNDPYFKKLIVNSRYYNCYSIITFETPIILPPKIRINIDYIFVFHNVNLKERRIIYEEYCSIIKPEYFYTVYDLLTKYKCIFIDNTEEPDTHRRFPYPFTNPVLELYDEIYDVD
jgi:hypothetical protein